MLQRIVDRETLNPTFLNLKCKVLLGYCLRKKTVGIFVYRKEAVALLKELGDNQIVQPHMVIIQQRIPDMSN